MKKKLLALGLIAVLACGMLVGCDASTATKEAEYTKNIKQQSLDSIGLPNISNFFEMSELKTIYELRDDPSLVCYWYTKNTMDGKWIYQGKCVGYGIPYSTQITNPETTISEANGSTYNSESSVISQAEPNGLYSTGSTSATWILTADDNGNIKPTYVEDDVTVTQTKMAARLCESWSLPDNY